MYIPVVPAAASMAKPKALPAAAPANAPPLSDAVITHSSAATRPMETAPNISTRARLISAAAAEMTRAALWRFSASSVERSLVLSASRKK